MPLRIWERMKRSHSLTTKGKSGPNTGRYYPQSVGKNEYSQPRGLIFDIILILCYFCLLTTHRSQYTWRFRCVCTRGSDPIDQVRPLPCPGCNRVSECVSKDNRCIYEWVEGWTPDWAAVGSGEVSAQLTTMRRNETNYTTRNKDTKPAYQTSRN